MKGADPIPGLCVQFLNACHWTCEHDDDLKAKRERIYSTIQTVISRFKPDTTTVGALIIALLELSNMVRQEGVNRLSRRNAVRDAS